MQHNDRTSSMNVSHKYMTSGRSFTFGNLGDSPFFTSPIEKKMPKSFYVREILDNSFDW